MIPLCSTSQNSTFALHATSSSHMHTYACTQPPTHRTHMAHILFFCSYFLVPQFYRLLLQYCGLTRIYTYFLKFSAKWTQWFLFWCRSGSYYKENTWFYSSMWLPILGLLCAWSIWGAYPLLNFLMCTGKYNIFLCVIKILVFLYAPCWKFAFLFGCHFW